MRRVATSGLVRAERAADAEGGHKGRPYNDTQIFSIHKFEGAGLGPSKSIRAFTPVFEPVKKLAHYRAIVHPR
jgi:hypothetical protein